MDYILLIVGLGLLLLGSDVLVKSSVSIAKKAKLSNFIIGFTIVGMGTSTPELIVSFTAALEGSGDMSIGNVVGSNICNILLILGVTAIIAPFAIERQQTRRDIPFTILTSILFALVAFDTIIFGADKNTVSRLDGIFLLVLFIGYCAYAIYASRNNPDDTGAEEPTKYDNLNIFVLIVIALVSLGALLYGGNLFLEAAKSLARAWGMSESVIAITIVAVGTSLPELITCIFAAIHGNTQLALGNVLGSNVFNILMIIGLSSAVAPITIDNIIPVDFAVMIAAAIMCYLVVFTFSKRRFDRIEGVLFILAFVAYNVSLLLR